MTTASANLTGWGRNLSARCGVLHLDPDGAELTRAVQSAPPGGLLARGLGRSYGDAALNSAGSVVARLAPQETPQVDAAAASVQASAGTSLGDLIDVLLPLGWMLPVVPGTRHVTVGGALAADIHGKNHHRAASLGAWTTSVRIVDGTGRLCDLGPDAESDLFWATIGGMGATGLIISATLRIVPVETSWVSVRRTRRQSLTDLLAALTAADAGVYQVAWVDGVRGGGDRRRSILEEGRPARCDELSGEVADPLALTWSRALPAPAPRFNALRSPLPRLLNAGWWHRTADTSQEIAPLDTFFFPLDRVTEWNRVYGPRGFAQYQFVVPWDAAHLVADTLDLLNTSGHPPILVVVKAMGDRTPGPLSFPMPGVTAAIDVADTGRRLRQVLARVDEAVARAGGRVYLAKDSTSRRETVHQMYPRINDWRAQVAQADPRGVFGSDLFRRLALR